MDRPKPLDVKKPWGSFSQYTLNQLSTVKVLHCRPGQRLSLQRHSKRDELWIVLDYGAIVKIDNLEFRPANGEEVWIPVGTWHRLGCDPEVKAPVRVLEISFGDFDENDIERREDDYGRVPKPT